MAYLNVKQKSFDNLEISENKGNVEVWCGPQFITIEKDNLQEFINQLENCL